MKRVLSILAVSVLFVGFTTSCEAETSLEETDALYTVDQHAGEDDDNDHGRGGS